MRWALAVFAGAAIGLSVFGIGPAGADPTQTPTPGPSTSSSDDLADMVMDVIERGSADAPSASAAPAPPH
jgi:hypothetical protein